MGVPMLRASMRLIILFSALSSAVAGAGKDQDSIPCPGSAAWLHASAKLQVSFTNSCKDVKQMVSARVSGQGDGSWVDPHNRGVYKITSATSNDMKLSHLTGNKKYT